MSDAPTISGQRPGAIGPGRLVLVVGPSGAGKDTLLGLAKAACVHDRNVVFPRRVVTRAASAFEDNAQVSVDAFNRALTQDAYAMHWAAHGHCYALPRAIDSDIRAGRTVIANVSRTVIGAMRRIYADVVVVLITAPPEILTERLAARGRGSDGQIESRLSRTVDDDGATSDIVISNVGSADANATRLIEVIRRVRQRPNKSK